MVMAPFVFKSSAWGSLPRSREACGSQNRESGKGAADEGCVLSDSSLRAATDKRVQGLDPRPGEGCSAVPRRQPKSISISVARPCCRPDTHH